MRSSGRVVNPGKLAWRGGIGRTVFMATDFGGGPGNLSKGQGAGCAPYNSPMLASRHGRRSRAARVHGGLAMVRAAEARGWRAQTAPIALLALPGLSGCSEGPAGTLAWAVIALALLLVAASAYGLGCLRERQATAAALRQARARARQLGELHEGWLWQTDASHLLLSWQGPGQAAGNACALFGDAALVARLRSLQAFAGLRVAATPAQDGCLSWELRGTPRLDDEGRFDGFIGSARPLDATAAGEAASAALGPALQAHDGAVLLATDGGGGWRVWQLNDAAAQLWPQLQVGGALADAAPPLPAVLSEALTGLSGDAPVQLDGWRLLPFGPLPNGARGLVLSQAGAAAAQAAPSAESDQFSFTVSHDLRAPIRVVEGFTRIVKEDYGRLLDRVGNDHLDRVLGAAARMNLMIDALLTLARLSTQPLARQPVNLSQLAGYVIDDLRRTAPEREAEVEIEPGLQTQGDPTLLRLVLENLLGNAWKYSARVPRAHIALTTVTHAGRPAYVVRDNGAGFDMRSAERLFGLFQRLHSASEFAGHGVGLASVRRIVRRHGGDIWAEAEPGRGAAFYFTLAG